MDANQPEIVLENAVFAMYRDENCTQKIAQVKTDAQGIARFKDIPYGMHVYIKEIQAPSGYRLSKEIIDVQINEEWINQTAESKKIIFENEKIKPLVETGDTTNICLCLSFLVIGFLIMIMTKQQLFSGTFGNEISRKRGIYGRMSKNSRRCL